MVKCNKIVGVVVAAHIGALGLGMAAPVFAQPALTADEQALGEAVRDRYDVALLSGGLALSPLDDVAGVRMIEVGESTIAIDGLLVTGQELRDRVGADADLIVRLTYLDRATRLGLFGGPVSPAAPTVATTPVTPPPPPAAPSPPPVPATPDADEGNETERRRRRTGRSNVVRILGSVQVDADERVRGDVVVIGGSVRIDGEVTGDVVVVGGSASFGPDAYVRREVTVIGGSVKRAPTARFGRGINNVGLGDTDLFGDWDGVIWPSVNVSPRRLGLFDLGGTVLRLLFLALVACIIVFVGRGAVERVAARTAAEPVKSSVVGFLAQVLFFPVLVLGILLLVVSLIGIPLLALLPFVLLAALLVMLVGFTGVVHGVGRWFGERMGRTTQGLYLTVWVGVALVLIPTMAGEALDLAPGPFGFFALMLGLTGLFVEYVAWTAGLGAVILNRFSGPLPIPAGGPPPPPVEPTPPVGDPPPPPIDATF